MKSIRLARGFTLDELAAQMGGLVTKQALSKYEVGKAQPSPTVLTVLARALGVKAAALYADPTYEIEFIAYRKQAKLGARKQEEIQARLAFELERRLVVQHKLGLSCELGFERRVVRSQDEVEQASRDLRQAWNLGGEAIRDLTVVLERKGVHLLEVPEETEGFHGLSAFARAAGGEVCGAMIAYCDGVSGERQRSTLGHELGHLLLDVPNDKSGENLVQSFSGAFLMPAELMFDTVGRKRTSLSWRELTEWKSAFGVSMANLIYRCRTLEIISEALATSYFKEFSKRGWRKGEPEQLPPEQPFYWEQLLRRAHSEGVLSVDEVNAMVPGLVEVAPRTGMDRRAFLRLPLEQRNRILASQAAASARDYEPGGRLAEWIDEFSESELIDAR